MVAFGVLSLQGDFAAHAAALRRTGVEVLEVRRVSELPGLKGLVLPGGESTALLKLMEDEDWFSALRLFHAGGGVILGTCAGAILLSNEVKPSQPSLGLLDATIERNAYGRQAESFEVEVEAASLGAPLRAVFIRAPRFVSTRPNVEVLGRLDKEPVLLRQGRVLAATFHPEIAGDDRLHGLFVGLAA